MVQSFVNGGYVVPGSGQIVKGDLLPWTVEHELALKHNT